MNTTLSQTIQKARQAILTKSLQKGQEARTTAPTPTTEDLAALKEAFHLAQQPVLPETLRINKLGRFASADAVYVAAGAPKLTKGARRLWELLHGAAVRVAAQKGYSGAVSAVRYSLPQGCLALLLGYDARHVRRLQGELAAAGLIDCAAFASKVGNENRWATMLWAVKTDTKNTTPRLGPDDFCEQWRDLEQDAKQKNTVQHLQREMSELEKCLKTVGVVDIAAGFAVTGLYRLQTRYPSFSSDISANSVQDAVRSLGLLADAPPSQRRELVQRLAGWLSDGLHDAHSFRWWCGLLWGVVGKWEAVGALQAQLDRLLADLAEWDGILNPAAWFAGRRRVAT